MVIFMVNTISQSRKRVFRQPYLPGAPDDPRPEQPPEVFLGLEAPLEVQVAPLRLMLKITS